MLRGEARRQGIVLDEVSSFTTNTSEAEKRVHKDSGARRKESRERRERGM